MREEKRPRSRRSCISSTTGFVCFVGMLFLFQMGQFSHVLDNNEGALVLSKSTTPQDVSVTTATGEDMDDSITTFKDNNEPEEQEQKNQHVTSPSTQEYLYPNAEVNWEHVLKHKDECMLSDDKNVPLPLVFMALGRTGSSVTWATMFQFTSENREEVYDEDQDQDDSNKIDQDGSSATTQSTRSIPEAKEIVGEVYRRQTGFYMSLPEEVSSNWPSAYICDLQRNFTSRGIHSGIVGFQWKPYMNEWDNPKSIAGMKDIVANNNDVSKNHLSHPKIKVIYQTRNPIDRRLSNMRHSKSGHDIPAHCSQGDEECRKEHEKHSVKENFTTGRELLQWLKQDDRNHRRILKRLDDFGVDYIYVEYEKLYPSEHMQSSIDTDGNDMQVQEWQRIFDFIGRGPKKLTKQDIQKAFPMAKTSFKTHKDMMLNYNEVKETLQGTLFEKYLN